MSLCPSFLHYARGVTVTSSIYVFEKAILKRRIGLVYRLNDARGQHCHATLPAMQVG
jgi:hypothetical protein